MTDTKRTIPGGYFLAFEGGENTGKSTQAVTIANWVYDDLGYDAVITREPGGSKMGQLLRAMLLDSTAGHEVTPRAEALLYAADRAHHVATVVEPALLAGQVVVCDRYMDSSIAYQGIGRGLGAKEVRDISMWAANGRVPDLTVLLDMSPLRARARTEAEPDRIEAEPLMFHDKVREAFLALLRQDPRRYCLVDAAQPQGRVTADIKSRVQRELQQRYTEAAARAAVR